MTTATREAPISFRPTAEDRRIIERSQLAPSAALRRGLALLDVEMSAEESPNAALLADIAARPRSGESTVTRDDVLAALDAGRNCRAGIFSTG